MTVAPTAPTTQRGHGPLVGDALVQTGHMLSVEARQMEAEEKQRLREEEAKRKEAARIQANLVMAQTKNSLADLNDEMETGLTDGTLDKAAALKTHEERSKKLMEDAIKGVAPDFQDQVNAFLTDDMGRSQRGMRKLVAARDQQDIQAGIVGYMEQMQRYAGRGEAERQEAMRNVEAFLQTAGPQAGMKAGDIARQANAFKEGVTYTWLDKVISQNARSGKALAQIQKDIAEDKFPELDPQKRTFLENKIMARQQHLSHQAEVAERRRMTQLEKGERRLSWYVENGRDIPAAELAAFEKASKGTPYEASVQMILSEQKAIGELIRLTPAQQVAKVKELEASYGASPSREQIMHIEKVKRFTNNSIKLLNESPMEYAVARDGAVVPPLDMAKPQEWASNLTTRAGILREMSDRTGVAPKGLFPQEAAALANVLKEGTVEQKRGVLQQLRQGFGDDKVFRATMQQIAPDNPVAAAAGIAAARGLESTQDRSVADLMLRGQEILNPNKKEDGKPARGSLLQMPDEKLLMQDFSSYERDAFAGKEQARNVFYQSAKAIYAAKSVEEGDYSGVINSRRWDSAMELATGGIEKYKGRAIVMPYGVKYGDFKDGLKERVSKAVAGGNLDPSFTPEKLRDLPLENVGDGRYVFRVGDGLVVDKKGRPLVIDFNQP